MSLLAGVNQRVLERRHKTGVLLNFIDIHVTYVYLLTKDFLAKIFYEIFYR